MITTLEPPVAQNKPYQPYGAAEAMFYDRSHEVMLGGPADTGKSRAILEKLHLCAEKYPGMRGLICRKTRRACTESALVTFEQKVVPEGHPILNGPQREQRHSYKYPNGSELVIGGLDEITKILSSEWDMIYVQEAREASEDDWEHLCTRASGRAGGMPYSQVLGDTNPDAPRHWIKLRSNRGRLRLLESRHEDNPSITPERLEVLDALTGVRYKRLRLGLWVAAEGIVYEGYDPAIHLADAVAIGSDWPRYLAVDFGFTNPFVAQWWAQDPDGRLFRYRELYATQRLVEDAAHMQYANSAKANVSAPLSATTTQKTEPLCNATCPCASAQALRGYPLSAAEQLRRERMSVRACKQCHSAFVPMEPGDHVCNWCVTRLSTVIAR
jgi:hypothetical protein